jgi:AcrR family transcriptional regulator
MDIDGKSVRVETGSSAAIIAAARKLFLRRGYDGVNLEAIAKKASVSRQTLYNNFGSKEALFKAVLNDHWSSLSGRAKSEGDYFSGGKGADELLRKFAQEMLDFIESVDQVDFTRLVIAESRRSPWIAREFYNVGKGPLVNAFARALKIATENNQLACDNALLAAHQFFGLILEVTFWPYVMAIGTATSELPAQEEAVEEAIRMFLARYEK